MSRTDHLKEVVPGIWTWSIFSPEKQINFNGWYVKGDKESVVIDPPSPGENILRDVEEMGRPAAILLTNKHHTRASEVFRHKFDSTVWIHEADKKMMEIPVDRTFKNGEMLPGGLKAITIAHNKTAGETAFLVTGKNALIIGDAVIGKIPGTLSLLDASKIKDPQKAKEGLKVLLNEPFDALLLGDGEPILSNGKSILHNFID